MTMQSLTPPERDTVISWSDADGVAHIWTAQRRVITKLRANPSAELVQSGTIGTTAWAEFRIPCPGVVQIETYTQDDDFRGESGCW